MPWEEHGKYKVTIIYRTDDENQVSLEAVEDDYPSAEDVAKRFAKTCYALRRDYNRTVVKVHRDELQRVNALIEQKMAVLHALDTGEDPPCNGQDPTEH